jgi:hypothetical protein
MWRQSIEFQHQKPPGIIKPYLYQKNFILEKPLVHKKCLLEKFEGKGGWTFTKIAGVKKIKGGKFGFRKVRGFIDDYEFRKFHLMPTKEGGLFLPVKAEIRKKINKKDGDWVTVILYPDDEPIDLPDELRMCLEDEPAAHAFFMKLSESEQKYYIQWIYSAKKEETKIDRMASTINRLSKGLKLYAKEDQ